VDTYNTAGEKSHIYLEHGLYTVKLQGTLSGFGIDNSYASRYLTKVLTFGNLGVTNWSYAFQGASQLTSVPAVLPAGVEDMSGMFLECASFNSPIGNWEVGQVTNMEFLFQGASSFNQDLSVWDVSLVTSFRRMFARAKSFNSSVAWGPKTSNVLNMAAVFEEAESFNHPSVTGWTVSQVTDMSAAFNFASTFNQDISNWAANCVTSCDSFN
jgi:surface protein